MDKFEILLAIAFGIYLIGVLCIWEFIPFIFKYGITFYSYNIGKMIKLDYSNKIGKIYSKKNTKIKVISENEFLFIPESKTGWEHRILPFFINKCVFHDGEYIIISKIPLTYLVFPLLIAIYYIKKDMDIVKILSLSLFSFFIIQLLINKWKMSFILDDIKDFINGNLL